MTLELGPKFVLAADGLADLCGRGSTPTRRMQELEESEILALVSGMAVPAAGDAARDVEIEIGEADARRLWGLRCGGAWRADAGERPNFEGLAR